MKQLANQIMGRLLYADRKNISEEYSTLIRLILKMDGGKEFPVIANTFALSDGANDTAGTGEYLEDEDCWKIQFYGVER